MAKQIIWSDRATNDLLNIFEYWLQRNKISNNEADFDLGLLNKKEE